MSKRLETYRKLDDLNIFDVVYKILWDKVDQETATDMEQLVFWEMGRYLDSKKGA